MKKMPEPKFGYTRKIGRSKNEEWFRSVMGRYPSSPLEEQQFMKNPPPRKKWTERISRKKLSTF